MLFGMNCLKETASGIMMASLVVLYAIVLFPAYAFYRENPRPR